MNRGPDHDGSGQPPTTTDDERLAALVRTTVDGWALPPQRLDQPTWRDQVDQRAGRGWLARLAAPAGTALVATVVVAFVAVWLSAPRTGAVPTASSTDRTGAPTQSTTPSATVPAVVVHGALPDSASVMVRSGGDYRIADLAKGTLARPLFPAHSGPTFVAERPDGGWVCICGDRTGLSTGGPTGLDVSVVLVDGGVAASNSKLVRHIAATPDPHLPASNQPEIVDMRASISADGRYAFLGWSARDGAAGWTAGIDVIDIASGTILSSTPLPLTEPTAAGGKPITRIAPEVDRSPGGNAVLISSFWYAASDAETPPSATEHWTATFRDPKMDALHPASSTGGDRCDEFERGLIDAAGYYTLCAIPNGGAVLAERYTIDGVPIGSSELPGLNIGLDRGPLVLRSDDRLFTWDPVALRLSRLDLDSGGVTSGSGTASAPTTDMLATIAGRIGRWLAPSVAAKVLLEPALVASPAGTRIYAIGIDPPGGESIGSRGIFVFDADSFTEIGHWSPTADFVSVAISPDGGFVYAAGDAGRTAAGAASPDAASITVFDTTDGSVRLVAGRLGPDTIFFPGSSGDGSLRFIAQRPAAGSIVE